MYKPQSTRWGQNAAFDGQTLYQQQFRGEQLSPRDRQGLAHVPIPLRRTDASPETYKSSNQAVQESTPRGQRAEIHKPFRGTAGAGVPLGAESGYQQDFKESEDVVRGLRHNPDFTKPSNIHLVRPDGDQYKSSNQAVQESTPRGQRAEIHKPFRGTAGAGVPLGAESGYERDYVVLPPINQRATRYSDEHGGNRAVPSGVEASLRGMKSEYDKANAQMMAAKPPKGKAPYFDN